MLLLTVINPNIINTAAAMQAIHASPDGASLVIMRKAHCSARAHALIIANKILENYLGHMISTVMHPSHSAIPV